MPQEKLLAGSKMRKYSWGWNQEHKLASKCYGS